MESREEGNRAQRDGRLLPLSATDRVLLKYCSDSVQDVSFSLLEIPHDPWQFTLMAVEREGGRGRGRGRDS